MQAKTGIAIAKQKIHFRGFNLNNNSSLEDNAIGQDSVLWLYEDIFFYEEGMTGHTILTFFILLTRERY